MGISVPSAQGVNAPVVRAISCRRTRTSGRPSAISWGMPPADPASPDNTLTVRDSQFGTAETIERSRWTLDGDMVSLTGGFKPGRIYQLSYPREGTARLGPRARSVS